MCDWLRSYVTTVGFSTCTTSVVWESLNHLSMNTLIQRMLEFAKIKPFAVAQLLSNKMWSSLHNGTCDWKKAKHRKQLAKIGETYGFRPEVFACVCMGVCTCVHRNTSVTLLQSSFHLFLEQSKAGRTLARGVSRPQLHLGSVTDFLCGPRHFFASLLNLSTIEHRQYYSSLPA